MPIPRISSFSKLAAAGKLGHQGKAAIATRVDTAFATKAADFLTTANKWVNSQALHFSQGSRSTLASLPPQALSARFAEIHTRAGRIATVASTMARRLTVAYGNALAMGSKEGAQEFSALAEACSCLSTKASLVSTFARISSQEDPSALIEVDDAGYVVDDSSLDQAVDQMMPAPADEVAPTATTTDSAPGATTAASNPTKLPRSGGEQPMKRLPEAQAFPTKTLKHQATVTVPASDTSIPPTATDQVDDSSLLPDPAPDVNPANTAPANPTGASVAKRSSAEETVPAAPTVPTDDLETVLTAVDNTTDDPGIDLTTVSMDGDDSGLDDLMSTEVLSADYGLEVDETQSPALATKRAAAVASLRKPSAASSLTAFLAAQLNGR